MFQGFHAFLQGFLGICVHFLARKRQSHLSTHLVDGRGHIVPGEFLGHNILGKV